MTLLSLWPPFHLVVLKVWSPDRTSSTTPVDLLQMHPRPTGAGASVPFCCTLKPGDHWWLFSLQGLCSGLWQALTSLLLPSVPQG